MLVGAALLMILCLFMESSAWATAARPRRGEGLLPFAGCRLIRWNCAQETGGDTENHRQVGRGVAAGIAGACRDPDLHQSAAVAGD